MKVDYKTLKLDVDADGILTITLARPAQLNAFTVQMANELVAAFGEASDDDAVRAIVVTGEGRAFCAGMDLSVPGNVFGLDEDLQPTLADMRDRADDPAILNGVRDTGGRVSLAIFDCKKPVIAAIHGAAVGIGATMTLPMDFRFAAESARIGFVFGRLGIVPEACSTWFLPRIVGMTEALRLCYSAQILNAQEALDLRLVSAVVPDAKLVTEARAFARSLVEKRSPVSVALIRQMMWRNSAAGHPADAHRVDSLAMFYTSVGDGKEGVAAFRAKRDPRFEGKASQMPAFYPWWQ